jgi:hypothetical protein
VRERTDQMLIADERHLRAVSTGSIEHLQRRPSPVLALHTPSE